MTAEEPTVKDARNRERPPPLQFGLRTMLVIMVVVGLVFGTLKWLGVSPEAAAMVLLIVAVSVAAALALIVAVAAAAENDDR